ncbi:MAG: hypothetical protein DMF87_23590 [Acidobacteria bacterium]|nr:MAG: hypothetical protein DMF87_23590 [Acidobacteriota bacterium]
MTSRGIAAAICVVLGISMLPAAARAQSTIAGVVKDTSGAVLPGVTVEASSDVLIERTRAVITDAAGQYKIVDLRPGVYVVTFTLTGFQTFRRDGLELPSSFTATVNADLRLGGLEETLTVTGESPIVDVQSTVHTQVLSRDLLDAVPSGRTIQGLGQLVVGINLNVPDVGGSRAMQQTYMSTHGMEASNNTVLVDGMMVNGLQTDGQVQSYFNDAMNQEVSYQTSGIGADTSAGGVRLNMIPKEGGNRFSGSFFSSWRDGRWQSDNFTQDLKNRGLGNPSAIDRIYDFNVSQGGPLLRDKLWFFVTLRQWSVDAPIAGTFVSDGTSNGFAACLRAPASCKQGIDDQRIKSGLARVTWQVSPRHKFAAYWDEIDKFRGHAMTAGDDYDTASVVWNSPAYHTASAKWTSTMSPKLLIEGGYSNNTEDYTNEYQPGLAKPRGSADWYAGASRRDLDLISTTRTPLIANVSTQSPLRYNVQASASYVTGSHNTKVGVQRTWGHFGHTKDVNADLVQQYRSATTGIPFTVPNSVLVYNTPFVQEEDLNYDLGVYGQDQWTLKRLTVNAGLRWEAVNAEVPAQTSPAGRFVDARQFAATPNVPNWRDPAPRFGVAYDLFGNGKTALKFSLNRYNSARTTGDANSGAQRYNPIAQASFTLPWTDLNRDDIAQGERGCVYLSPGCEINFATLPSDFGRRALTTYDPNTRRTWNLESGVEVQHELLPRVSVTASWYRGNFHNELLYDNQLVTLADWTPVSIFNPIDGKPMTIYNLNPSKNGQVATLDTSSSTRKRTYNSYGLQFSARLPYGATLFGGLGFDRLLRNTCDEPDDPNQLRFCDDAHLDAHLPAGETARGYRIPYLAQGKVSGSISLPAGVQVSGAFQSNPGYPNRSLTPAVFSYRAAGGSSWLLSRTTRYPANCPAPCPAGELVLPTLNGTPDNAANLRVQLIPYSSEGQFTDRINQLDLRVTKSVAMGRVRVLPQLEIFNVFNSSAVILQRSTDYSIASATAPATFNQPAGILNGRIIGLGAQVRW